MFPRRGSARLLVATAAVAALSGCSGQTASAADTVAVPAAQPAGASSIQPDPPADGVSPAPVSARAASGPGASEPGANEPGAGPGMGLPAGVTEPPATTSQLVTAVSASPAATTATLRAWERQPAGGWRATMTPLKVRVGTDGVGKASESSRRTPAGSYPLDQAFGRAPDPGTKLPYRHVGNDDWWVSDTHSPAYNTYRHCRIGTCTFNESAGENLGQAGPSYDYAVVIGYNTIKPVAGAGSAFFLHVDAGAASAGCVEVPRATAVSLLRWLDPVRHPRITIVTG